MSDNYARVNARVTPKEATTVADGGRTVWRVRLQTAVRKAVACTIIGSTTLYGPEFLKRRITFPAFAYVTAVLIVCEGNLGESIRGCWHAFCATIQVVPITMLSLQIIGLNRFFPFVAALAVAVISFVVALPESTALMCKRIAFGQLVIIYVNTVIHREDSFRFHASMHPLHVAASTALGAISALLAMLFPYPRLSYYEVRKLCRLYGDNAAERTHLYLQSLTTNDRGSAKEFIAKAKPLDKVGKKIIQSIIRIQDDIVWERPWTRLSRPGFISPANRLRALETPMRGMKIALNDNNPPLPAGPASEEMVNLLLVVSTFLNLKAEQARGFLPFNSTTVPDLKTESTGNIDLPYETIHSIYKDLSAGFFLSCAQQFIDDYGARNIPANDQQKHVSLGFKEFCTSWFFRIGKERWMFATKCSLSLFSAVLIGLLFKKEQAYWSGLTIAISFVEGRQAVFAVANVRAQGTALGSVYGVLGCFIFQKFRKIRFLCLYPWIISTSFLMHSRMYGQAGGTAAVIGALLILGRNNYVMLPDEFAIIRLTEAIMGLCCFLLVELLSQPAKASTLAKKQLYLSLLTLEGCIQQLALSFSVETKPSTSLQVFRQNMRNLSSQVQDLEKFIQEAEVEPKFSFLAFPVSEYKKVHQSLSSLVDLLSCMSYSLEYSLQISCDQTGPLKEIQEHMLIDLELCKETLDSSLKYLEKVSNEIQEKACQDEEKGNIFSREMTSTWNTKTIYVESFRQSKEIQDSPNNVGYEEELKGKVLVSLTALGFCTSYMVKKLEGIERVTKELIQWEYSSSQL